MSFYNYVDPLLVKLQLVVYSCLDTEFTISGNCWKVLRYELYDFPYQLLQFGTTLRDFAVSRNVQLLLNLACSRNVSTGSSFLMMLEHWSLAGWCCCAVATIIVRYYSLSMI